ncbi:sigma factor-like helix-turn-helix DNA-binding protein [Craterilacuibacter sp.]|uniref:sigma factor-like helix-turn-helix DNA-binding protein n=1 Tax=Craterilacuibacter sp. TaxID=2870909 RepID=UPI003F354C25
MATRKQLSDFLRAIEAKARYQASLALPDPLAAQEAVSRAQARTIRLYAAASPAQLPLLFQRTLAQVLARSVRRPLWARLHVHIQDADAPILLETLSAAAPDANWCGSQEIPPLLHAALALLPAQERQAYLLRHWLGFSPQQAASSMACSRSALIRRERSGRHALHTLLAIKGLGQHTAYASLDSAIAAALNHGLPAEPARLSPPCQAALDALAQAGPSRGARLRPWLALKRQALFRLACYTLLACALALVWPQLEWPQPDLGRAATRGHS